MIFPNAPARIKETEIIKILGDFFSYRIPQPIANQANCYNSKRGKEDFTVRARDFSSPSHPFIFDKKDTKPA